MRISAALETVLAPALLPRTRLSQRILQELREVCPAPSPSLCRHLSRNLPDHLHARLCLLPF